MQALVKAPQQNIPKSNTSTYDDMLSAASQAYAEAIKPKRLPVVSGGGGRNRVKATTVKQDNSKNKKHKKKKLNKARARAGR